jgi:hypothetical protein
MSYQKDNKYTKKYHDLWSKVLCFNRSKRPNFLITINRGSNFLYLFFIKGMRHRDVLVEKAKIYDYQRTFLNGYVYL